MKLLTSLSVGLVGLVFAGNLFAAEVQVSTQLVGKDRLSVVMDLTNAKGAAGFSFRLAIPGLSEKGHTLGGCAAELPKNWSGACNVVKGAVYVFATSDDVQPLQNDFVSIGKLTLAIDKPQYLAKKATSGAILVDQFSIADFKGKEMAAEAVVDDVVAGRYQQK